MRLLPIDETYSTSRLSAHWAAQLPAAASCALVAQDDFSHTNLFVRGPRLEGRPLPDGRRAGVSLADLVLSIGDEHYELSNHTIGDALKWMGQHLGAAPSLLKHDLPHRDPAQPFQLQGAESQLHAWFSLAHEVLSGVATQHEGSELRLWPHHFDLATLIELSPPSDGNGEDAPSINVGFSPGDGSYAQPYWYVTPWPRPQGSLPTLSQGKWHQDSFLAAVLPASEHGEHVKADAETFVKHAIEACRAVLAG